MIWELWNTYVTWYGLLKAWASLLVPEAVAASCARRSLAEVFLQAVNAVETADGPYVASLDVLYKNLCMEPVMRDHVFVHTAFGAIPYPDEGFLCDVARLYAATYHMSYTAMWTLHEREAIRLKMRLFDPIPMSATALTGALKDDLPISDPVRCGVERMDAHTHAEELICAASLEIWQTEEARGLTWLSLATSEKGDKQWQRSARSL